MSIKQNEDKQEFQINQNSGQQLSNQNEELPTVIGSIIGSAIVKRPPLTEFIGSTRDSICYYDELSKLNICNDDL